MSRTIHCVKLGVDAEGLDRPPYPGALGQRIYEGISKQAWQQWMEHQTRIINEYKLVLADASARKFLLAEAEKFFFGGDLAQTGYVAPAEPKNP